MIHAAHRTRPYGPGRLGQGLTPCFFFDLSSSSGLGLCGRLCLLPPCIAWQNSVNRLCTWNVRGINGTAKREEVVDVFRKGKFQFLALMEAKLKGNGEVSWYGLNGIIAGVQEME